MEAHTGGEVQRGPFSLGFNLEKEVFGGQGGSALGEDHGLQQP